jgi:hypothetical protein
MGPKSLEPLMVASLFEPRASEIDLSWDEGATRLRAAIEW